MKMTYRDLAISAGTVATLTGETHGDRVELIASSFTLWAIGREFRCWQHAWNEFWTGGNRQ
jgi:hypothetical protein